MKRNCGRVSGSFLYTMDGTLYIVDALNYLFRAFHALPPLSNSRGVPTGAVYGLCQMLLRIEREWRPTHLCVIYDAPGPTFRDDIFAAYKANRPPMPAGPGCTDRPFPPGCGGVRAAGAVAARSGG